MVSMWVVVVAMAVGVDELGRAQSVVFSPHGCIWSAMASVVRAVVLRTNAGRCRPDASR